MRFKIYNIGDDGLDMKDYIPKIEQLGIKINKDKIGLTTIYYITITDISKLVELSKLINYPIIVDKDNTLCIVDGYLA